MLAGLDAGHTRLSCGAGLGSGLDLGAFFESLVTSFRNPRAEIRFHVSKLVTDAKAQDRTFALFPCPEGR